MFVPPCDASLGTAEWQVWIAESDRFGILAVNDPAPPRPR
jgi:transcriptional regulator